MALSPKGLRKFWSKVDKNGPIHPVHGQCWTWTGHTLHGYGKIQVDKVRVGAHRFSWIVHFEDVPPGLYVLHKCDNRSCVNPDHLFLGTYKDNRLDMFAKNRQNIKSGEDQGSSKLTDCEVIEIRKLYKTGNYSQRFLGSMFGVDHATIGRITCGRGWKHLLEE